MGIFDFFRRNKHEHLKEQHQLATEKNNINSPVKTEKAYLVFFSASWCGPSKSLLKDITDAGITCFTLIDAEKEDALASKYGVRSIPTILLFDENDKIIKKWVGYDDEDPGQSKFIDYIKNAPYKILPYSESATYQLYKKVYSLVESVVGTDEKPAKVEKQKLSDGSIYTGEARLCKDGFYTPYGYGEKILNKNVSMFGKWIDGRVNGVCYMNMHFAMITGQFRNNHPKGWCLSIQQNRGYVFGYFDEDDCKISLGNEVLWMIRSIHNFHLYRMWKYDSIIVGERIDRQVIGFHFMNNGDAYVGAEDAAKVEKTGFFFKFTNDGRIQIGFFSKGQLVKAMKPRDVIEANGLDTSLAPSYVDTDKKYF